jgi:hypothetical protein
VISVPAPAWWGGAVYRAFATGLPIGVFFAALAWLDSGIWLAGVIVFVLLGASYGVWMARRMSRYWPGAAKLDGADRVAVVRSARRGEPVAGRVGAALGDYCSGLHAVVDNSRLRRYRWVVWLVLAVAAVLAVHDAVFGSVRNGVASAVYLGLIALEVFWWPRRLQQLLASADTASFASAAPTR